MTWEEFYEVLENVSASRESRLECARLVNQNIYLLPHLIDKLFDINAKDSCKAAWVLEFVCADHIYAITPYLDRFTKNIHNIHLDSAIRPVAKICSFIVQAHYAKDKNPLKNALSPQHKTQLIATNFDWMINEHKVATKVFAMETLFHLGKETPWVHIELKQIIERDFQKQSAAYKARAKQILQKLKKQEYHKLP